MLEVIACAFQGQVVKTIKFLFGFKSLSLSSAFPPSYLPSLTPTFFLPSLPPSLFFPPWMLTIGRQLPCCEEAQTTGENWHTEELGFPADGQHQPVSWLMRLLGNGFYNQAFLPELSMILAPANIWWNLTNHQAKPLLIPDPQTPCNNELFLVSKWCLRSRTCKVLWVIVRILDLILSVVATHWRVLIRNWYAVIYQLQKHIIVTR